MNYLNLPVVKADSPANPMRFGGIKFIYYCTNDNQEAFAASFFSVLNSLYGRTTERCITILKPAISLRHSTKQSKRIHF